MDPHISRPRRTPAAGALTALVLALAACEGNQPARTPAAFRVSGGDLTAEWKQGLPFPERTVTYTLRNAGTGELSWRVSATAGWVVASVDAGTLAAGKTTGVTLRFDASVLDLPPGTHEAAIAFEDLTTGAGSTARTARLEVVRAATPYWRWKNGPPDDPSFFPIGVWLQVPRLAPKYADLGINTYVGLWNGPTNAQLATLHNAAMPVVALQNNQALGSSFKSIVQSWAQVNQPDNAQWNGRAFGPPIPPATLADRYADIRAADASRPVFLNFGPGVAFEDWIGRGVRRGRLEDYPDYVAAADIVAFNVFPVAKPPAPEVAGALELVGKGVARLAGWAGSRRVVWNFLETTHVESPSLPTPAQIRAEAWMSIIHGSMGIVWFVHEWYPSFREDAIFRYPNIVAAVKAINARITALAPVLNSPTLAGAATVEADDPRLPLAWMVKRHGGATWLFAVSMRDRTSGARFEVGGSSFQGLAEVVGESRSVPVLAGKFVDSFVGYQAHIYRIPND